MANRALKPPISINHKLGRVTCHGNGLLLNDIPYEPLVDRYQPGNLSVGDKGLTQGKLAVQCKFRGQSHDGTMTVLFARIKGQDYMMSEEFLLLTRMMNREYHRQNQPPEKIKLGEAAESVLKERFSKDNSGAENYIEELYEHSDHLEALQGAAEMLGLILQSTQGPDGLREDKHHIVIGRTRKAVSERIQRINIDLYRTHSAAPTPISTHFQIEGSLLPSPTNIVAIRDPNPPHIIAGKWLMKNPNLPHTTYPMTIWNEEVGSLRRQIFCKLEFSNDIYIRFVDPSLSAVQDNDVAALSMNAFCSPSAAKPQWNLLWRSKMGVGTGIMTFGGRFGFEAEIKLRIGMQEEGAGVFQGYKSRDGDGEEVNIEAEWAVLGGGGQRMIGG